MPWPLRVCAADNTNKLANVHNVAIISVIGDYATMKQFGGLAPLLGEGCIVTMADRDIDDAIRRQIISQISPSFAVANVPISKAGFFNINPDSALDGYEGHLRTQILALPPGNGVDAYIVVRKAYLEVGDNLAGPWVNGLGVLRSIFMLGIAKSTTAYAVYDIDVVDAKTGEVISSGMGHTGGRWFDQHSLLQSVDSDYWTTSEAAMSPERKAALADIYDRMIADSLPFALQDAGLVAKTSAPEKSDKTSTSQQSAPAAESPQSTSH